MIDRRKTAAAWRARARELYNIAEQLRTRGDHERANQFERAAAAYTVDADKLAQSTRSAA